MPSLRRARSAKPAEPSRTTCGGVGVRLHQHAPAGLDLRDQAPVHLERELAAGGQHLDAEALAVAEHDGAVEEAVRRVGRDDHRARLRRDQRAAGREGEGGRADRGGDDHARAGVADEQLPVDAAGRAPPGRGRACG